MAKVSPQTAALRATADKAALTIPHLAYQEGASSLALAAAIRTAFTGYSLGKWDASAKKGQGAFIPSDRFNQLYDLAKLGYVAARLTGDNSATDEASRIEKATAIIADKQRGEAMNTILAAFRQSFNRSLQRAGLETPRAKEPAKATGDKTKKGQGKVDDTPSATVEVKREDAAKLPPAKPNRENVVEYIRTGLAAMALCIEQANQAAAKAKGKAVPPQIQTALNDWVITSRAWVI